jgi:predicted acetyltransferase
VTAAKRTERSLLQIEMIPATSDQEPILANLLELYAHDFSEFHDIEVGEDGRFGYKQLPLYWHEEGRRPFLVRVGGRIEGLVLVKRWSEMTGDANVWDMAEFFILRRYRRLGIGTRVAHEVWRLFPGQWEVRVMEANAGAQEFWKSAIAAFVNETIHQNRVERNGEFWCVFSFEARSQVV